MGLFKSGKKRGAVSKRRARVPTKPSKPRIQWLRLLPVFWVMCLLALVSVTYPLLTSLLSKPVARVLVTGDLRYVEKQRVIDELKPLLTPGFILLDLPAMRDKLLRQPWIDEVRVMREWPRDIQVMIREQRPIARWGNEGFLNHRGVLFTPKQLPSIAGLPLLRGPDGSSDIVMMNYRELGDILRQENLQLAALELDERHHWSVKTVGGVHITLGRDQIMNKMRRFIRTYRTVLAGAFDKVEGIDMRYSNGLAVAWKQG